MFSITTLFSALKAFSWLSWFLRNWKAALAGLVLAALALAYHHADMNGYKRRLNEEKAQEISLLQARIATLSLVASLDNQRALSDATTNNQLDTLSRDTPKNDGVCLDIDAARRVRSIQGPSRKPLTAPIPAKRHSSVLPWRSKRP